jgi:hypothetical protein
MVETSPPATLVVIKSNLLLELLVVTLNAPAQLGAIDQSPKADRFGQG